MVNGGEVLMEFDNDELSGAPGASETTAGGSAPAMDLDLSGAGASAPSGGALGQGVGPPAVVHEGAPLPGPPLQRPQWCQLRRLRFL